MFSLTVAILIVIFVSAFCSLLEAVLYAVPISRIESMAKAGSRAGRILQDIRTNVDRPIIAILSLNTIANTAGAAVAGALAVSAFGEVQGPDHSEGGCRGNTNASFKVTCYMLRYFLLII